MSRFTTLAAVAVAMTYLLVLVGAVVRATDSGLGCPEWPTCHGSWIPPLNDPHAIIEWSHRTVAALTGAAVAALALVAVLGHRDRPALVGGSVAAAALVVFQAWLGKVAVESDLSGEIVTAHLATAMGLFAVLLLVWVRSRYPRRLPRTGGWSRFTILAGLTALGTYGLMLLGAHVTATGTALVFEDWPFMDGGLFPALDPSVLPHVLHRWATVAVGLLVVGLVVAAGRGKESAPLPATASLAGILYVAQVVVGGAQVLTNLAPWAQVAHVALGAAVFGLLTALAVMAHYVGRLASATEAETGTPPTAPADLLRAYVALTKPRIIELLLVTTVPTMVLAQGGIPPLPLVGAVLIGGSLAAGGANAINQYLDRDIDERMRRTRNRPLPRHAVSPRAALAFGLVLSVVSFAWLAVTVNLLSAVLAASAIVFYAVVYTAVLKRSTPQNIVIGGAAGCVPVLVAWAAVTNTVGLPAIVLFGVIFVWTPPHFWALALRYRSDYEAAGVPMLPVVSGEVETARQILLYSLVLVAVSLVLLPAAGMGVVYFVAATGLGLGFVVRAVRVRRSPAAGPAAIGLFRYSTLYLTLLFAAVAADTLVRAAVG
ncbi:MAG: heme o synthase [Candidatus Limnocylindria bacterium]